MSRGARCRGPRAWWTPALLLALSALLAAFQGGFITETLRGLAPYEARVQIMEALREFSGGVQEDDVTVVVLGREIA